jgi:hypothetical protein
MLWFFLYLLVCIVFYYILYQLSDYDPWSGASHEDKESE